MAPRAPASLFSNIRTTVARLNPTIIHLRPASSQTSSSTTAEPQNQNKSTDQVRLCLAHYQPIINSCSHLSPKPTAVVIDWLITLLQHANPSAAPQPDQPKPKKKTIAELDEELKLKMAGLVGDGGEAGVEYEDGQPVAMKRSVKANMFRYI